jgi:hypothetical protein
MPLSPNRPEPRHINAHRGCGRARRIGRGRSSSTRTAFRFRSAAVVPLLGALATEPVETWPSRKRRRPDLHLARQVRSVIAWAPRPGAARRVPCCLARSRVAPALARNRFAWKRTQPERPGPTAALDDEQERRVRLLLLGKGADVVAHRFERPLAAEMDEKRKSRTTAPLHGRRQ